MMIYLGMSGLTIRLSELVHDQGAIGVWLNEFKKGGSLPVYLLTR